MKTTNCSFQIFKLATATTVPAVIMCGISVRSTQAGYIATVQQVGPNVVATGSGAIDLTGLSFFESGSFPGLIAADTGTIITGPGPNGAILPANFFQGVSGPTSFGSGGLRDADSGSGDYVGIGGSRGSGSVLVPQGYVSGTALSDSMTFNNETFSTLGVIPGTYEWTWGTGLPNQNFTLIIGGAGVPDGGSTVSLLGCALLGLAALRRKLSC